MIAILPRLAFVSEWRMRAAPVLSETTVRSMWNSYLAKGYYEPTAGIHWGAPQIVAYIKSTMG